MLLVHAHHLSTRPPSPNNSSAIRPFNIKKSKQDTTTGAVQTAPNFCLSRSSFVSQVWSGSLHLARIALKPHSLITRARHFASYTVPRSIRIMVLMLTVPTKCCTSQARLPQYSALVERRESLPCRAHFSKQPQSANKICTPLQGFSRCFPPNYFPGVCKSPYGV